MVDMQLTYIQIVSKSLSGFQDKHQAIASTTFWLQRLNKQIIAAAFKRLVMFLGNAIEKDESRMCKHILLKFPADMELSNSIYSTDPRNSQMKMTIVPYPIKFNIDGGEFQLLKCRVLWKVHLVEEEERIVEEVRESLELRLTTWQRHSKV
jgi:hypothetical protein